MYDPVDFNPEETFLPEEILIHILQYLSLEDIKACRLVNRKWNLCCEEAIKGKNKFVLHSGLISKKEMAALIRRHTGVAVHFANVSLEELDFQSFGQNIMSLELENCHVGSIIALKTIFLATPNMRIFHCYNLLIGTRSPEFDVDDEHLACDVVFPLTANSSADEDSNDETSSPPNVGSDNIEVLPPAANASADEDGNGETWSLSSAESDNITVEILPFNIEIAPAYEEGNDETSSPAHPYEESNNDISDASADEGSNDETQSSSSMESNEPIEVALLHSLFDNIVMEGKFRNYHLRKFTLLSISDSADSTEPLVQEQLRQIFPSLKYLQLSRMWNIETVRLIEPKLENKRRLDLIMEGVGPCFINFRKDLLPSSSLEYTVLFPKLKKLDVFVYVTVNEPFFDKLSNLLSQLPELEELYIFFCSPMPMWMWNAENVLPFKLLLVHVLNNCKKLRCLTYEPMNVILISLNEQEAEEVVELIRRSNLRKFEFDGMELRQSSRPPALSRSITNLHTLAVGKLGVTPRALIEECNLKHLKISLRSRFLTNGPPLENRLVHLADILEDQKDLVVLRIDIPPIWKKGDLVDELYGFEYLETNSFAHLGNIRHDKLYCLDVTIGGEQEEDSVNDFLNFICSCEFKNLHAFYFTIVRRKRIPEYAFFCEIERSYFLTTKEFIDQQEMLSTWLQKMQFLEIIAIDNFCMTFAECAKICSNKTHLRKIEWTTEELISRKRIIKLFKMCTSLKYLTIHRVPKMDFGVEVVYYYCRLTRRLFKKKGHYLPFELVPTTS